MESHRKRQKPRLDRRNAMKNFDYHIPPSSPSFESSSSSFDLSPSLTNQTSFRVKGVDGEFDLIFRTLGLSGPEDFAIPAAAWEQSQRSRLSSSSSSNSPVSTTKIESSWVSLNGDVELKNSNFQRPVVEENVEDDGVAVVNACSSDSSRDGVCVGIKGIRPPVLAPPPGTFRFRPFVDQVKPTWDLNSDDDAPSGEQEEDERGVEESGDFDFDVDGENERVSVSGVVDESNVHNVSPHGSFRRTFTSWQKGEILGKGSFGTVYEGFTDDGFFFAVKEVSLLDDGSQGKQSIFQLQQEISLLGQFEHENIVQYLGTDKDDNNLYIFLELVTKGSLAHLYQKYCLRDSQVSSYTRHILSGLKYLHDRNVVHRDIKCANILVDANGSVKLADFGLAKATTFNDVKSSKGSPYWMAPEVVNLRNRGYGLAADIWSLGCTVLEMLTRQPPYSDLEGMQAIFRIGRGQPPPVPESLSKEARDFILKCLQVNPGKRPTAAQLSDHPFVKRPLLSPISPVSPRINLLMS